MNEKKTMKTDTVKERNKIKTEHLLNSKTNTFEKMTSRRSNRWKKNELRKRKESMKIPIYETNTMIQSPFFVRTIWFVSWPHKYSLIHSGNRTITPEWFFCSLNFISVNLLYRIWHRQFRDWDHHRFRVKIENEKINASIPLKWSEMNWKVKMQFNLNPDFVGWNYKSKYVFFSLSLHFLIHSNHD